MSAVLGQFAHNGDQMMVMVDTIILGQVQDHMSDQYSPPDAPLNAPVDPWSAKYYMLYMYLQTAHQELVVLSKEHSTARSNS